MIEKKEKKKVCFSLSVTWFGGSDSVTANSYRGGGPTTVSAPGIDNIPASGESGGHGGGHHAGDHRHSGPACPT